MNPRSAIIMSASVALAITVIVFGHLLFSKKTTALDNIRDGSVDTSGWKTYTNGQFGFEIKYPNSWVPGLQGTDNITGKMVSVSLMKPYQNGDTKIPTAAIQFFIQYNGNPNKLSIHDWAAAQLKKNEAPVAIIDTKIGEESAILLGVIAEASTTTKQFFVTTNNTDILMISYRLAAQFDPIYEAILSSMTFIK